MKDSTRFGLLDRLCHSLERGYPGASSTTLETLDDNQKKIVEEAAKRFNEHMVQLVRRKELGEEVSYPETRQQRLDIIRDIWKELNGGESGKSGP